MIAATAELLALMRSGQVRRADLWTITPKGLAPLYWTSADLDVSAGGITYLSTGSLIERGTSKLLIGLDTDTLDLKLFPARSEVTIAGAPLRQAAQRGVLDGADVRLSWAYLSSWGPPPVVVGTILRFVGSAGTIDVGRDSVDITVNSPLKRLDLMVPTKVYGAQCRWTLGDAGCGVNLTAQAASATIGGGSTDKRLVVALPDRPMGWPGGTITVTSGASAGLRRTIQSYADGMALLVMPLPWAPTAGDQITATPGCDKVHWGSGGQSCIAWGNTLRFGGQPYIPAPETAWS